MSNAVDKALEKIPDLKPEDMVTGGHIITSQEWTSALVFARGRRRPINVHSLQSSGQIKRPRHYGDSETTK